MSSTITRAQIRSLVIQIIRSDLGGFVPVREISRLGEDLGISPERRAGYLAPIKTGVRSLGYELRNPLEFELRRAHQVREIVDAVWSDIQQQISEARQTVLYDR